MLVWIVAYAILPITSGKKMYIYLIVVTSVILTVGSPMVAAIIANSDKVRISDAILIGILAALLATAAIGRRTSRALINDPEEYNRHHYPDDASTIRVDTKRGFSIRAMSWFIVTMYYGGFCALILLPIQKLLGLDIQDKLIYVVCLVGFLYASFLSFLRLLIRCEHCHNNLFEMLDREFVKMSLNAIFNKYVVCMYCHARFALAKNVDLDKLENNYQYDYQEKRREYEKSQAEKYKTKF